ncbi:alkaline-phosphatase-like protein [Penicillium riverlandense]|uniref:alkaline-phosphatase-like protein n=1 Tax=Penicillium riverlandense TaxID=1903569 RepID=UPI002547FFDA|nr:alkaline-phosphatase-like protein [Penicillium riverlandense]KAJ5825333.1 alkaline-phosphatase-like protein [Penicillium riverlandense]
MVASCCMVEFGYDGTVFSSIHVLPTWVDYFNNPNPILVGAINTAIACMRSSSVFLSARQAALRKGPWKLNFVNKPFGPEAWKLYNVLEDPGEVHDLKEERNDKLEELLAHWHDYARETGVVGFKPEFASLMAQLPDEMENPVNWMKFETSRSVMTRIIEGFT